MINVQERAESALSRAEKWGWHNAQTLSQSATRREADDLIAEARLLNVIGQLMERGRVLSS